MLPLRRCISSCGLLNRRPTPPLRATGPVAAVRVRHPFLPAHYVPGGWSPASVDRQVHMDSRNTIDWPNVLSAALMDRHSGRVVSPTANVALLRRIESSSKSSSSSSTNSCRSSSSACNISNSNSNSNGDQRAGDESQGAPEKGAPNDQWDMFTRLSFGGFFVSLGTMVALKTSLYLEFNNSPSREDHSFLEFFWYRFSNWFGANRTNPLLMLLVTVQAVCTSTALAYSVLCKENLSAGVWKAWSWIMSPDGGGAEARSAGRLIGALASIGGIFVFAMLVSMLTEEFTSVMDGIKSSQAPLVEAAHTVLLGWTDKSIMIVQELCTAYASEGGGCIAVLDPRPIDVLRKAMATDLEDVDLHGTRVVARSGETFLESDLRKVSVASAKSVIVQVDPSVPNSQSDALSMQKVATVRGHGWPKDGHLVVHLQDSANTEVFQSLGGENTYAVVLEDLMARLMFMNTRCPSLSHIWGQIFGFDGSEFYIQGWDELAGRTFQDVVFSFEDAVVVGLLTASGETVLCPAADHIMDKDDQVIVLASDNDSYSAAATCIQDFPLWCKSNPLESKVSTGVAKAMPKCEHSLIVGWSDSADELIQTLAEGCAKGSECTVLAETSLEERQSRSHALQQRLKRAGVRPLCVNNILGSPVARSDLGKLPLSTYDNIFVLADVTSWNKGPLWERPARMAADAKTVASLLLMRNIITSSGEGQLPCMVPEILDEGTTAMLTRIGFDDFVDSNSLVSRILATVSEAPAVLKVIQALVRHDAASLFVRRLDHYFPEGAEFPSELSWWDVMCRVRQNSDDLMIAWSANGKPHDPWTVNPNDKKAKVQLTKSDRVVVISNDPVLQS